ncbi:AEC family transporter [Rhodoferax saidenbachensis]|uniref:Permease n=1 Tax=Rhodoferax saidenbachensis TaxID=1484693 RepID=A0A1P8K7U6_9BURK|nr:AEC family transporter [Rhodoferax saidenbachensis]APW42073.1 permease [Rhodoferax saidenbachensis]
MLEILAVTGPTYVIIALGYLCTRGGLFSKTDMRVLGKFVLNIALPALLFNALSQRSLREVMHMDYLVAYGLGALVAVSLGFLWARYLGIRSPSASTYFAMGVSSSNSGFMGYPIALMLLGPEAGVALALNMLVENLLILPLLLVLADRGPEHHGGTLRTLGRMLGGLARNPMIMAIAVGFAFSAADLQLPGPLARTVTLFSQASTALALFVIGGTLVGLQVHGLRARIAQITVGKLVGHPLAVLLVLLWLVPVNDPELRTAAVLYAAMPMLGIYPLLAEKHGHQELSAATLLVTTVASFFTISALIGLLRYIGPWG